MTSGRVVLVSRELAPFGGGIGTYVSSLVEFLAGDYPITVVTSSSHQPTFEAAHATAGLIFDPSTVEIIYVDDPDTHEIGAHYGFMHAYSSKVFAALVDRFADEPPALIEFQDYLGEGAVTIQARQAGHPMLVDTRVVVRLDTTAEMCAVLNGAIHRDYDTELMHALERVSLRGADALLYGGGDIYGTYQRFYGAGAIAPGILLRQPIATERVRSPAPLSEPLELLYTGRLERRKGVESLVRGMTMVGRDDVRLTLVGGDTDTAPLGGSMLEHLRLTSDGDSRIDFIPALRRDTLARVLERSHVAVFPSLWECWPAVVLESLARNRPVLTTPVGGMREMAGHSAGRFIDRPGSPRDVADAIEALIQDRSELEALIEQGVPNQRFDELTRGEDVRSWYADAVKPARYRSASRRPAIEPPLVSVVVPYHRMADYVEDTLRSLAEQTYPAVEILIVNDGSFEVEDRVIFSLANQFGAKVATQSNAGLGAARNFGIDVSRGKYVAFLDADNELAPTFIERAVASLESNLELSYFTTWSSYIDYRGARIGEHSGYSPLGNQLGALDQGNVAGDAAAVFRRSVFDRGFRFSEDLSSYEDWDLYRQFRDAGFTGAVAPERLLRYRVRPESMLRQVGERYIERFGAELASRRIEGEMTWVP